MSNKNEKKKGVNKRNKNNVTNAQLAIIYGINRSPVSKIWKNKEKILQDLESDEPRNSIE
ncbi:hypothetical protein BpHYR1_048547 [Brachionus plicatilis]|uniref:Uncharacterized protein n=1 Tax=Brachionus plicatilis TaxID=10195 RepID=A0A3M7QK68_BRAPC|nr:hypothetical protein BpHYR1_048547 [Brachionus plicatilis]